MYKDNIEIIPIIADVQNGARIQEVMDMYTPLCSLSCKEDINTYHLWNIIL